MIGCSVGRVLASAVLCFAVVAVARAQDGPAPGNPCVTGDDDDGRIVYDRSQGLCWLADANLAGDPDVVLQMNVDGINPNGTMDWPTALQWVEALNHFDNGRGYLGHNNWQLPVTPMLDDSCSSFNNGSFGASCTGSAFGSLYSVGLNITFPDSVVPNFVNRVGPFRNIVPGLYWTSGSDGNGEHTFSFTNDIRGSNTTKYNYMHVLPMVSGPIDTPPAGEGVLRYTSGVAAGKAVYDWNTGYSWVVDANLASTHDFGVSGTTTITSDVHGTVLTVPSIDADGAMLFDTASVSGGWLDAMNASSYAGSSAWQLPAVDDLKTLFNDLGLQPGSELFDSHKSVGPFQHFQPFFYWACQRDQDGTPQSPCNPKLHPPDNPQDGSPMRWSFNFDNGFQGTDETTKQFYVLVYYPAPQQ